jgi:hypothetical protein
MTLLGGCDKDGDPDGAVHGEADDGAERVTQACGGGTRATGSDPGVD